MHVMSTPTVSQGFQPVRLLSVGLLAVITGSTSQKCNQPITLAYTQLLIEQMDVLYQVTTGKQSMGVERKLQELLLQ